MRREGCGGGPGTAARRLSASRVPPFNITAQNTVCRCRQGTLYHPNEDSSNNSSFGGAVTWVGPRPELRHFMGMGPPPPPPRSASTCTFFLHLLCFGLSFHQIYLSSHPPTPWLFIIPIGLEQTRQRLKPVRTPGSTGQPSPPPPPTLTPIFGVQKNGIYRRTHFHGPFLMHKLLIHRLPPPPCPLLLFPGDF